MARKGQDNLTEKQEKFCQEYVIDLNGTQAATRAGYSEKTSNEQASKMLAKVNIQERVQQLQKKIQKRTEITADNVVKELAKIGFMSIDELFEENGKLKKVMSLSDKAKASVSSIKVTKKMIGTEDNAGVEETTELKLWDKGKALVELGKHLGIFKEDNSQKAVKNIVVASQEDKELLEGI